MRMILAIIATLFAASIAFAADELPSGWRFATDHELHDEAINWRDDSPSKYTKAEADFNGDGKLDQAYLVKSTKHNGQALIVHLSTNSTSRWVVLDEIQWDKKYEHVGLSMGIEVAEPQTMKTACGKGYFDCNKGEPTEITLSTPGIDYFKFGGASSVFYWDKKQSKFIRIWTSD